MHNRILDISDGGARLRSSLQRLVIERDQQPDVTIPFADVDRAVIDRVSDGFLRVHHEKGRIIAATIVGAHAGELIGYCASAMRRGERLGDLSQDVFPYPTLADAVRKAGDAYQRTRLTPGVLTLLRRYFAAVRKM